MIEAVVIGFFVTLFVLVLTISYKTQALLEQIKREEPVVYAKYFSNIIAKIYYCNYPGIDDVLEEISSENIREGIRLVKLTQGWYIVCLIGAAGAMIFGYA